MCIEIGVIMSRILVYEQVYRALLIALIILSTMLNPVYSTQTFTLRKDDFFIYLIDDYIKLTYVDPTKAPREINCNYQIWVKLVIRDIIDHYVKADVRKLDYMVTSCNDPEFRSLIIGSVINQSIIERVVIDLNNVVTGDKIPLMILDYVTVNLTKYLDIPLNILIVSSSMNGLYQWDNFKKPLNYGGLNLLYNVIIGYKYGVLVNASFDVRLKGEYKYGDRAFKIDSVFIRSISLLFSNINGLLYTYAEIGGSFTDMGYAMNMAVTILSSIIILSIGLVIYRRLKYKYVKY